MERWADAADGRRRPAPPPGWSAVFISAQIVLGLSVPAARAQPAEPASDDEQDRTESSSRDAATDKRDSTASMGAGNPLSVSEEDEKRWTLAGSVEVDVGSSILATDDAFVALAFNAQGFYRLSKLWEGQVDAVLQLGGTQRLDASVRDGLGGTAPQQFFFSDIVVGFLGRRLFLEDKTGISFGANTLFRLPTSDAARAFDRRLRWDNTLNAARSFGNVGPGTAIFVLRGTFRKDFAPDNPSLDDNEAPSIVAGVCSAGATRADGTCASDQANLDWGFISSITARYLTRVGLNFSTSFSIFYNRFSDIGGGEDPETLVAGDGLEVGSSPNSVSGPASTLSFFTAFSIQYVFNPYLSASTGIQTLQNAFVFEGDSNRSVSNPFFAEDAADNSTSFFFNVAANY
ncbi:MAG: hypothetical protein ACFB9M_04535 [Myxococcota bacterium]